MTTAQSKQVEFTPGQRYTCAACGWSDEEAGRPRCLPCGAKASRAWRAANPDKARQHRNLWRIRRIERDPGYAAARAQTKRANNPAKARGEYERRRNWLAAGTVTRIELRRIWERDNGRCRYCAAPVAAPRFSPRDPRGFDHVVARANGGQHEASNIVVCCGPCNAAKSHGAADPAKGTPQ